MRPAEAQFHLELRYPAVAAIPLLAVGLRRITVFQLLTAAPLGRLVAAPD